jgi:hypothetical protein
MTIRPGYGTEQLHLRQTSSDLRAKFGLPEKRWKSDGFREYWSYPKSGFECIVSTRSGIVLSIFLKAASLANSDASGRPMFGADEDAVLRAYSKPALEGGGSNISTGAFVGRWYSYESGIGFYFDKSGHVETISVFAPKRKRYPRVATSDRRTQSHGIAALRSA